MLLALVIRPMATGGGVYSISCTPVVATRYILIGAVRGGRGVDGLRASRRHKVHEVDNGNGSNLTAHSNISTVTAP